MGMKNELLGFHVDGCSTFIDLVHDLTCQKSSIGVIVLTAILSISLNLDVLSTALMFS